MTTIIQVIVLGLACLYLHAAEFSWWAAHQNLSAWCLERANQLPSLLVSGE
jgi:hypothetical protein